MRLQRRAKTERNDESLGRTEYFFVGVLVSFENLSPQARNAGHEMNRMHHRNRKSRTWKEPLLSVDETRGQPHSQLVGSGVQLSSLDNHQ
jgi:hypothetical protein